MEQKYRLKVKRDQWDLFPQQPLPKDIDNKATLSIIIKNPTKVKQTKKKCVFLCSGYKIDKELCQGKWDKRFLIEPTIDGITIETIPGFYFVNNTKKNG